MRISTRAMEMLSLTYLLMLSLFHLSGSSLTQGIEKSSHIPITPVLRYSAIGLKNEIASSG